ncbi:MAG: DNA polymerase III subunit gamma/tau [Chlorobiaceae bacterium]
MPLPVLKRSGTGEIDLGSWQKKLSGFASNPAVQQIRADVASESMPAGSAEALERVTDIVSLKVEWRQFLEHVSRKTQNFMATHLQSCELEACSPGGVLDIVCCRKFSYEELLQDVAVLQQEVSEFYALPLKLRIRYDAEKDACTKEKTVFTIFQELSEKNEVIRFLIREFGGELVY